MVAAGDGQLARLPLVIVVGETGERAGLGDAIRVEGLPRLLQHVDQVGLREAVADAEIGEALDFRKRPQHHDVAAFPEELQRVGRVFEELVIRLIEDHDDVLGHFVHETVDLRLREQRAGGVVRIGDENLARARRDRGGHGVEVVGETGIGHLDGGRAEKRGHELVNDEGVARADDLVAGVEKGFTDELDDFVRATAEDHVFPFQPELRGDALAQIVAAAVGVKVGALKHRAHRVEGLGRRAERVFVGGELDDLLRLEPEFARHVLDRFSRFVGDEFAQPRVGGIPK